MFHPFIPAIGPRSAMSVQKQTYGPGSNGLPQDFGERLDQFMRVSGLGPRPLSRRLGVSPHRIREWRRGVAPSGRCFFRLLALAEDRGLGDILMRQDVHVDREVMERLGDSEVPS